MMATMIGFPSRMSLRYFILALCLALPLSAARAVAAEASGGVTVLKRDSGTMKKYESIAGGGHFVEFECPPGKWYLVGVQVYGSRYGTPTPPKENWTITLCDTDFKAVKEIKEPYSTFERSPQQKWYRVELPPLELPAKDGKTLPFWLNVDFNPHQTKGVYVGYDGSTGTHSRMGLPGEEPAAMEGKGEWMVRAIVSQQASASAPAGSAKWTAPGDTGIPTPESEGLVELKNDTGKSTGQQSIGGEGPVVTFTNVPEGATLQRLRIYGSRYGGNFDPAKTQVLYYVFDDQGNTIANGFFPYSTFGFQPKWVDAKIPPVKVPSTFSILINPEATQNKGLYFHYDATGAKGQAKAGSSPDSVEDLKGSWNWMIRAYVKPGGK